MSNFSFANVTESARPMVLEARGVVPIDALASTAANNFAELIIDWDAIVEEVGQRLEHPDTDNLDWRDPASLSFAPAGVPRPAIYCAGANYADHIAEMGGETIPRSFHFPTPPGTLNGHGNDVVRPRGVTMLDWEVELAAVIGRRARHVPRSDALSVVLGYTVANDVSVRDPEKMRHPIFGVDWMAAKNGEGLTVLGPGIVPARLIRDHADLDLRLTVNGETRQKSNTAQMIVTLAEQIESLSAVITLEPGDVVLTGTPAGTAAAYGQYLNDGDVVEASVAGIGTLRNTIVPPESN